MAKSSLKRTAHGGSMPRYNTRAGGIYKMRAGTHTRKHTKTLIHKEQTIVLTFIEMLNTIKLHHWKTMSYATHKATDELYSKLNENTDTFVEIMLGKNGSRINLTNVKSNPICDFSNSSEFLKKMEHYKQFLVGLNDTFSPALKEHTDILNVRDELLGNLNQFMYLMTFS
jgi:DNA-binding ferritin-like protein